MSPQARPFALTDSKLVGGGYEEREGELRSFTKHTDRSPEASVSAVLGMRANETRTSKPGHQRLLGSQILLACGIGGIRTVTRSSMALSQQLSAHISLA